jgi:hypothetical protein
VGIGRLPLFAGARAGKFGVLAVGECAIERVGRDLQGTDAPEPCNRLLGQQSTLVDHTHRVAHVSHLPQELALSSTVQPSSASRRMVPPHRGDAEGPRPLGRFIQHQERGPLQHCGGAKS